MNGYNPYLSKSLYIKGCQCPKALWLKKYHPELADEISAEQQALFDSGTNVGILAQQLFPDGVLIPCEGLSMAEQLTMTAKAIADGVQTLYEASFSYDDIFFKADIMHRTPAGWDLYEVKAATAVKDVYLDDVSLQRYVLCHSGLRLNRAHVVHINNQYVRKGDVDVGQLFAVVDITTETDELIPAVPARITELRQMLQAEMPSTDIGPHCSDPYSCEFAGHCWQHLPSPSVFDFTRIGKKAFDLYYQGIHKLEDVPTEHLNAKQRLQQAAWVGKKEHAIPRNLKAFVDSLQYPLCYMDFETFAVPVPLYDDTRPYCQVPFQYSLHIQETPESGLLQKEFLADGKTTPQREFTESLLAAIPPTGSVIVWNQAFEIGRLKEMQLLFPTHRQALQNVIDRVMDLMVPFRNHDYYHWQFQGSYSIKKVLPVLAPELSYDSLAIQNGSMAPSEWLRMTQLDDPASRQAIRKQLLEYCGLDTYAMVRILEEVRKKI